jgi:hypothetical protein
MHHCRFLSEQKPTVYLSTNAESGVVRTKADLVAYSRWLMATMGDATDADEAPVPRETASGPMCLGC